MELTDLMIGDWVFDTVSQSKKKILGISDLVNCDKYKPIELNWDILHHNGIDCGTDVSSNGYGIKHGEIYIKWSNWSSKYNYFRFYYFDVEDKELDLTFPIKYVHELQHAIKLFGIDKNIEL